MNPDDQPPPPPGPTNPARPVASGMWQAPGVEQMQAMLPQYEILEILGRGGMGAVYKGRQKSLKRLVAIKILPPDAADDEMRFVERFENEAQTMAAMNHPAIVSVYDFGETAEGLLYFIMEFVDGTDVHKMIQANGKLGDEYALAIAAHVCDALDYAHSRGVIHRDIKPANILIDQEGRVKVADFGLAKMHDPSLTSGLTRTNMAMGTPDYVAPEALTMGMVVDHRADLYAVGVMLYQMLTGEVPRGMFRMPSEKGIGTDPRFDEIICKAMESDRDHRYQTAGELRRSLDEILTTPQPKNEGTGVVPVTTLGKGGKAVKAGAKMPVYLGIAAAAVLVVGLIVTVTRGGKEGERSAGTPARAETAGVADATKGKADGVEQTPVAPKPSVAPVANTGKKPEIPPAPQEEKSGTANLPVAAPSVASVEKTPEPPANTITPKPASLPAKTTPLPEEAPEPVAPPVGTASPPRAPPSPPPAAENLLAAIPGFKPRLDAFHTARKTQLTELATKYGRGLDSRLDQAADSGDLTLSTAFANEKDRVTALAATLKTSPADPIAATGIAPVLEALPEGSPEALAALRQTWNREAGAILTDLDGKLRQSLQTLEAELTRARQFEQAKTILAWRESLAEGSAGTPARTDAPATVVAAATEEAGKGTPGRSARAPFATTTKDAPFENSLGMKFVPVPGTEVLFCIHEVRYRDYAEYAKEAKESVEGSWKNQTNDGFEIKNKAGDHPVTSVSWEDAQTFCKWLSEKEGFTYRLPTDREWSLAVGIGRKEDWKRDTTPATVFKVPDDFPWGDDWPPPQAAGNYSDESRRVKAPRDGAKYLDGYDDGFPTTAPVMSFEANKLGLYDLGGNGWEWCRDWYSEEQKERVLRGASWSGSERDNLLSSFRGRSPSSIRDRYNSFRIVLDIEAKSPPPPVAPPGAANHPVSRP